MTQKYVGANEAGAREAAYKRYINFKSTNNTRERASGRSILVNTALFLSIWGIVAMFGSNVHESDYYGYEPNKKSAVTLKQRLRDAFWPISNGWYVRHHEGGILGGQQMDDDFVYHYSDTMKGEFAPRGVWYVNMAFLLTAACIVIGRLNRIRKENKFNKALNKEAAEYNQICKDTVDMVLGLCEGGKDYRFDLGAFNTMLKVAPDVVADMSGDDRLLLDRLLNGEYDDRITTQEGFVALVYNISYGYLIKHRDKSTANFIDAMYNKASMQVPKQLQILMNKCQ